MPTTVHVPKPLLAAVDRRARALKISRNRLVVHALQREVDDRGWSPGFLDRLTTLDAKAKTEFRKSMRVVQSRRRSKRSPVL